MRKFLSLISILGIVLFLVGCSSDQKAVKSYSTNLSQEETNPEKFKDYFPLHYASYLKNAEMTNTEYSGSVKESKYIKEPQLPEVFKGYGFAKEYNEDRGHIYAVEDVAKIKRVNDKTTGSCWTCKSTEVPGLINKYGSDYYKKPFNELKAEIKHPIGCSDCHDPKTMELRITRPAFVKAMKERGVDVSKATKNEMRSYVCGQCHVEYYFEPGTKEVTFPWDEGFEPEEIFAYYEKEQFSDWEHPTSQAKMIKTQHPEFETWATGTHGKAGVGCSDCHMPYMQDKNGTKYSSHWWTSPLKTVEVSCLVCHKNQGEEWIKERVNNIQKRTFELQDTAADLLVEAHKSVNEAIYGSNPDKVKIAAAQADIRKAQWYWDWVAAENSRGFHNPEQSLYILGQSINEANKAIKSLK